MRGRTALPQFRCGSASAIQCDSRDPNVRLLWADLLKMMEEEPGAQSADVVAARRRSRRSRFGELLFEATEPLTRFPAGELGPSIRGSAAPAGQSLIARSPRLSEGLPGDDYLASLAGFHVVFGWQNHSCIVTATAHSIQQ